MKKIILFILTLFLCSHAIQAQKIVNPSKMLPFEKVESKQEKSSTPAAAHVDIDLNAFQSGLAVQNLGSDNIGLIGLYNDLGDEFSAGVLGSTNSFYGSGGESYLFSDNDMILSANGEAMRLLTNGNVGIGTSTPNHRLQVQGDINAPIFGDFTGANVDLPGVFGNSDVTDYYGYGVQGFGGFIGVEGVVNPSGSDNYYGVQGVVDGGSGTNYGVYGFATNGAVNYAGYFDGDLNYTGALNGVSDLKFKENIRVLDSSILDKINTLQPKNYEFKKAEFKEMNLSEGEQFGFIAQELQQVFPALVSDNVHPVNTTDENGIKTSNNIEYLGVNYMGLIPILTKGIQELSTENKELKTRLAELEAAVEALTRE